jgi:hypothetical protein
LKVRRPRKGSLPPERCHAAVVIGVVIATAAADTINNSNNNSSSTSMIDMLIMITIRARDRHRKAETAWLLHPP